MPWVRLRSRTDPVVWIPLVAALLLLVPLGLGAHVWASDWVRRLHELAAGDPAAARAEAARVLRLASWSLCALTAGGSAILLRYFQLGRRESRLPPSGWWSRTAYRVLVGAEARRRSQLGLLLAGVLLAAALGLALAAEHLIRLLEPVGIPV